MKTNRSFFSKNIDRFAAILLFLVLITTSALTTSYSRFVSRSEGSASAKVASFAPEVGYDGIWEESVIMAVSGTGTEMPFQISTAKSETTIRVTLTLVSDGVLPYEFEVYLEGTSFPPASVVGNTYTFSGEMEPGLEANLRLVAKWPDGEYDERFSGLVSNVAVTLTCEQID